MASLGETQVSTLLSAWRKAEQWRWKSDPSPRMPVESQGEPESPYSLLSINTYLSIHYILKSTASAKGHCYWHGDHTRIISRWVHVWSPIHKNELYNIHVYIRTIIPSWIHIEIQDARPNLCLRINIIVGQWDLPQPIQLEGTPPGSR